MQSRFGTDADSNLPLKAIREWFSDNPSEKTFTVRGSLGNTSISFDRSDFQDHKADNGDVYNGLSGAGWYLRTGILQTNAVGIGAPHVHINAVTMDTKGYSKTVLNNGAVIDNNTESKPETKSDTKPESKTDRDSKKNSNVTKEDVINATRAYIDSLNGDYRFLQQADYFIAKHVVVS